MAYPDYPNNRLIVNGVDLTEQYQLILIDGYTLNPPSPKTYVIDIPGGNGSIDLTETLLGDTAYDNREQEFTFYVINVQNFERLKTEISNFLHGKSFDYQITMDPEYTYHGRFTVSGYSHTKPPLGVIGCIKISIVADPYKYQKDRVCRINAVGGATVYFESGRKRVRPTIESGGYLKVIHNNKLITLQQGSWTVNDILFEEGLNEVYFNSYDIKNLKWSDLKSNNVTWSEFKGKRLYEWYKSNGDGTYIFDTWLDQENKTWESLANTNWGTLMHISEIPDTIEDVYVQYKVGDL